MSKAKTNSNRCKGCYYCIKACPKDAISIMAITNKKGYQPIHVNEEKCIGCGICYQVCPDYVFEIV
ncbi:4Fe-4S binding protein [Schnuerera ultunensis]|uniref:4Fe-4S ferredoxin-type domain-containing protein n=1 Tax=[Clostridium] ultunense Esp TaxID=1288971 RepID=A0A1M4PQA2_9FIRM|nr:4Fe-4S binding protein [Schnuerera ultunensis]SHD77670.1 conserved protein of unknown function [[Clostridium] ultunense Esp]